MNSGSSASTASAPISCSRKPITAQTYAKLHTGGLKANYDYRLEAMDRAFQGGLKDLGIGLLFGLHDWRYEILALLQHIAHLEKNFGVGPHTISVPRLEPAVGSDVSTHPPYPVTDDDFRKIIAVLRIAVPYTGIILSTRESAAMRREAFELGVSQISAGSRTNPGGYSESAHETGEQFSLGDTRPLMAVIKTLSSTTIFRRSAPAATAWAGWAKILWTWPSRASSSSTACPMPCSPLPNTCMILPMPS